MADFIAKHKKDWDELRQLLAKSRRFGRSLSSQEVSRLDELYRRTTVHLSQIGTRMTAPRLVRQLNDLVAAAHSYIYLPPRKPIFTGIAHFIVIGFARAIARTWQYQIASLILLMAGGLLGYYTSGQDVIVAYALLPAGDVRMPGSSPEQLLEVLRSGRDQDGSEKLFFSSFLFANNLRVGLLALGMGVVAGIPTILLLIYNGMLLGAFAQLHHRAGIYGEFWAWILPHGVTEIGAIILCGGVGLMLGHAVVRPGFDSVAMRFRQIGGDAARVSIGVAGMLFFAAIIESFLRQSYLSTSARFLFAGATALFWALYICLGFLSEERRTDLDTSDPWMAPQTDLVSGGEEPIRPRRRIQASSSAKTNLG